MERPCRIAVGGYKVKGSQKQTIIRAPLPPRLAKKSIEEFFSTVTKPLLCANSLFTNDTVEETSLPLIGESLLLSLHKST